MTPRERIMAAINRQQPDRVPADYKAEPEVNEMMTRRLGVSSYDGLLERLEVDVRRIDPRYIGVPNKDLGDGVFEDYWGIRSKRLAATHGTYDQHLPTAIWNATTVEELEQHNWPSPDIFDYSVMKAQCEQYPEYAVLYEGSDLFTRPSILRGMENLFYDLVDRPEVAHYILEKFTAFYCEDLTRALEATNGGFQFYCEWSDYGTQQGLLISREMWLEFAGPYLKRLIDICHSAGVKFMMHSCGAIREILPEVIKIGTDVLDPIQIAAKGMEPAGLQRDFGDKLCFHGGVCTQTTLPFGTPEDVRRNVTECVRTLGASGGYILAPSHNIQADTSAENILAMYDPELRRISP
jgi:uroporphyrinogen decarboxylase